MTTRNAFASVGDLDLLMQDDPPQTLQEARIVAPIAFPNEAFIVTIAGSSIGGFQHATYPLAPTHQRPLSDQDFVTLLSEFRASLATSARATETVGDRVGQAFQSILSSLSAVLDEVHALRAASSSQRLIALSSLGVDQFRLRRPVMVEILKEDGLVLAHSADFEQYGSGETEYDALDDLRFAIADSLRFLIAAREELATGLKRQLERFTDLIEVAQ